jgi:hypothetical protein
LKVGRRRRDGEARGGEGGQAVMETNMNLEVNEELKAKGQALLTAAYEFWKAHQRLAGRNAVVWLDDTSGHFVLFTRGEYKSQIIQNIHPLMGEIPLKDPFTADVK